jgi:hypothetical protein
MQRFHDMQHSKVTNPVCLEAEEPGSIEKGDRAAPEMGGRISLASFLVSLSRREDKLQPRL